MSNDNNATSGFSTLETLLSTISDLNMQLMEERARGVRMATALAAIRDEAFGAMEGAGVPEFEYYADWHALATVALQDPPETKTTRDRLISSDLGLFF